eukprot:2838057-Amphidinium_carterae.1
MDINTAISTASEHCQTQTIKSKLINVTLNSPHKTYSTQTLAANPRFLAMTHNLLLSQASNHWKSPNAAAVTGNQPMPASGSRSKHPVHKTKI